MNIQHVAGFPKSQYFQEKVQKKRIALHHTAGSTAEGAITFWKQQKEIVGTAYVIDMDGTIYKVFDDACWAYQFGLKNVQNRTEIERTTIGIEIVNLGPLVKTAKGFMNTYGSKYNGATPLEKDWRGYKYWQPYTDAQMLALSELLKSLATTHNIKLNIKESIDFDLNVLNTHTVFNHANVRRDKLDLSPAFDFLKLKNLLA